MPLMSGTGDAPSSHAAKSSVSGVASQPPARCCGGVAACPDVRHCEEVARKRGDRGAVRTASRSRGDCGAALAAAARICFPRRPSVDRKLSIPSGHARRSLTLSPQPPRGDVRRMAPLFTAVDNSPTSSWSPFVLRRFMEFLCVGLSMAIPGAALALLAEAGGGCEALLPCPRPEDWRAEAVTAVPPLRALPTAFRPVTDGARLPRGEAATDALRPAATATSTEAAPPGLATSAPGVALELLPTVGTGAALLGVLGWGSCGVRLAVGSSAPGM
mmetsp:Transcript_33916/g.72051  ORF Transcript_33916/g.72051 Transcript_33916/m.72051 type:complete len:273 (-) Transcript_33916:922-1740(-)